MTKIEPDNKEAEDKKKKKPGFLKSLKPKKINYRHYFGGLALILIFLQLATGLYMIFYYEPSLKETYKTVQYFNNETTLGAITRNIHRYGAFLIVVAVFVHFWRGYFRRDYQGGRKTTWLTGLLMAFVIAGFVITGSILPWEWKGYWMMEMFNNWLRLIPVIGNDLYDFFMTSYTPTRNFVIHDIILPLLAYVLLQIHCLGRLKKRGFYDYAIRQIVAVLPLIAAVVAMGALFPVPTEDPQIIPLPMDGEYIPAPENFFVTFLLPFWYFRPREWVNYVFWVPAVLIAISFALPYINKRKSKSELEATPKKRLLAMRLGYIGAGALVCLSLTGGFIWGSANSPWMGCNSCHNTAMGTRMGIPPVTYKDTERNPLLLDNRWMIRHWYQPQVVW